MMTVACPATTEFVVPRSIPTDFAITIPSLNRSSHPFSETRKRLYDHLFCFTISSRPCHGRKHPRRVVVLWLNRGAPMAFGVRGSKRERNCDRLSSLMKVLYPREKRNCSTV